MTAAATVRGSRVDTVWGPAVLYRWRGDGGSAILWRERGGRLSLLFGDAFVPIEHRTADGEYLTARDALRAVRAFVGAAG